MERHNLEKLEFTKEEVLMIRKLQQCILLAFLSRARCLVANLSQEKRRKLTKPIEELGTKPAIFVAIDRNNVEFVTFLVTECNADIEEQLWNRSTVEKVVSDGMSPLELAFSKCEPECYMTKIVDFLLNAGADVSKLVKDKNTILKACQYYSLSTVRILAEKGADLNVLDEEGNSCLAKAVFNRSCGIAICQSLLDNGVDVNCKNNDGQTVLHAAVRLGQDEFAELLLKKDVDVNCKNKDGETALHVAARLDRFNLVKILLQKGADPYSRNNNGDDSLRLACLDLAEKSMNMLLKTAFRDVNRHIEAYQLLGANYLRRFKVVAMALPHWEKAVKLYSENQTQINKAKLSTPLGVIVEAISSSELEVMRANPTEAYMQALVLIHKHLGETNPHIFVVINDIIAEYFDSGAYDSWWRMLTYFLQMARSAEVDLPTRQLQLQIISNWVGAPIKKSNKSHVKLRLGFSLVYEFFERVVREVAKCIDREERKIFAELILHLIALFHWIDFDNQQKFQFLKLVRLVAKLVDGVEVREKPLLISAFEISDRFLDRILDRYDRFSAYSDVVTTLLECGADVNGRDQTGNNVAHLLQKRRNFYDANRLRQFATTFVDCGIHLDARNDERMETAFCLQNLGFNVTRSTTLMCIAARCIREHKISFVGIIPQFLYDFVEMH